MSGTSLVIVTQYMYLNNKRSYDGTHHHFHQARMESFTGMTCCLAHLDINDANEKEIPEIDQSALG